MGFINKLIGGFFSFLGSIFKVFNIFKTSEYYLEAPETSSETPAAATATAPAAAPKPAAVSNGKVEKPAATMAAAEPVKVAAPTVAPAASAAPVQLFAPNFLGTASSAGRRRPGPSLSPYMVMAKKVKA